MLAPLLAVLALAGPPADLDALFADTLPAVKARTSLPILLPDSMPSDYDALYPSGTGSRRSYSIGLAAAPDCGGANACFVADFSARKGGTPFGRGKVTLTGGRHGRFQPLSCGASCSPPSISWKQGGVTYSIQANVGAKTTERRALVRMANEAIKRGPR
ncbi:hypothetical protein [Candidatus Solirubrobacter pratensis]|uniref:hypothetical protein n=1 Tax=Candidatus Solirubrobacter pratensis TaxID=1298857 RepID=UPI00041E89B5|nr:hypothetical protein [Candidatus Solirubrobacter pratensis]